MKKRLFVGNLGTAVKRKQLKEKLSKFGDVENVELHTKNDESGKPFKKFAYLDVDISQEQLVDCIKELNNLNWKGSNIIVQVAKESYIQRIQREALQGTRGGSPAASRTTPAEPSPGQERRSHAGKQPCGGGSSQVEFAEEKAFLFGPEEEEEGCAWGLRSVAAPEDKRQRANAQRLASLKQRAAQGQAQRRLLRQDLAAPDQHKRRIVFADSEDEDQGQGQESRTRPLFLDEEEEEEEDHFRLRPHFQGRLGHKALELQSSFAADDRFRLSERFWDSEAREPHPGVGGGGLALSSPAGLAVGPWDGGAEERSRNLDILGDVLGPAAASGRSSRPLFRDASQLRFDPTREDAAQFELQRHGKPPRKKEKAAPGGEEEAPAGPPQVSSEQFYEVSSGLHDALASSAGGGPFSLAHLFASQLEGHDEEDDDGRPGGEGHTASGAAAAAAEAPPRQVRALSGAAFLQQDDSTGDEEEEEKHGSLQPARLRHGQPGPVGDMFRRMDDHRFATVVDRPLFFFVPGDRRLLEGAQFFRCQSDPDRIRRNFLDSRVALVKLLLSKRKMAKRALERRHGRKAPGSQQWRLGRLRHSRRGHP